MCIFLKPLSSVVYVRRGVVIGFLRHGASLRIEYRNKYRFIHITTISSNNVVFVWMYDALYDVQSSRACWTVKKRNDMHVWGGGTRGNSPIRSNFPEKNIRKIEHGDDVVITYTKRTNKTDVEIVLNRSTFRITRTRRKIIRENGFSC